MTDRMPLGQVAAGGHPHDPQQSDQCWGSDITPLDTLIGGSSTVSTRRPRLRSLFLPPWDLNQSTTVVFVGVCPLMSKMSNIKRMRARKCCYFCCSQALTVFKYRNTASWLQSCKQVFSTFVLLYMRGREPIKLNQIQMLCFLPDMWTASQ